MRATLEAADGSIETWTADGGEWRFKNKVPPGTYTLKLNKPGWTVEPAEQELTVTAGDGHMIAPDAVAHSSFKALPDAPSDSWAFPSAFVKDDQGKKMVGASFVLIHPTLKQIDNAISDLDGFVAFSKILGGSYRTQPIEPNWTFTPPYLDFSFAQPTAPGESLYYRTGVVFIGTPSPGKTYFRFDIAGRVLGPDGKGKADIVVTLGSGGGANGADNVTTDADGKYAFLQAQHIGHDLVMVYAPSYDTGLIKPFAFATADKPEIVMPDMQ